MNSIQEKKPVKTCQKTYANYTSFKPYLRADFNNRCGYCDCDDYHAGGSRGFQIDHFKPVKLFEGLKLTYSNLVYSCPYCNRAKWDKWKDPDGFLDPCTTEYDDHLHRNDDGQIMYNSDRGKYIFEELKLGLERHEILWLIRKLENQKEVLNKLLQDIGQEHEKEVDVLRRFVEIQNTVDQHTKLFRTSI